MKIAYVCYWFLLERDGVVAKIEGQVAEWRAAGHDVEVFCLARRLPERQSTRPAWRTFFFGSPPGRFRATRELVGAVETWHPDVVYLRYDLFLPPLPRLVGSRTTAIEVNANDREEARLRMERPRAATAFNELNRRVLFSRASGLVCVTRELAESDDFASFAKPTVTIGNGVDLERLRELPPAANERPRIVFLGSAAQCWHGVDKISLLAERMPEADFDIVGYEADLVDFATPPNMRIHPPLARGEYEPLLARADLAIGTLGLHRKNMREACPLKVREYLGHGLPVVIAYDDTDFAGEEPWFLLRLPNEESNVRDNVDTIRDYLGRVRGRRVPRREVQDRIGSRAKERRRLEFFEGLAS
jgi:hypothetical protein